MQFILVYRSLMYIYKHPCKSQVEMDYVFHHHNQLATYTLEVGCDMEMQDILHNLHYNPTIRTSIDICKIFKKWYGSHYFHANVGSFLKEGSFVMYHQPLSRIEGECEDSLMMSLIIHHAMNIQNGIGFRELELRTLMI